MGRWFVVVACVLGACGRIGFDPQGGDPGGASSRANMVFVTSTTYSPLMGALAPYDAICQTTADGAGLTGTYVAFLSNETSARDRISRARGFVRRDGLEIADLASDMSGRMRRPVIYDENGDPVPPGTVVMTGSDVDGRIGGNCNGLTYANGPIQAGYADGTMSSFGADLAVPCDQPHPLYCVGIDRVEPLTLAASVGRRVFIATGGWHPGGGLADADAFCAGAATNAGLTGSFKAFLATATQSASSRFSAAGANWVRLDGVAVAATPADFLAGTWIAPINVEPDGSTYVASWIWFGAAGSMSAGTAATTCSSWTASDTSVPTCGDSASIGARAFQDPTASRLCNDYAPLYCVEE